MDVGTFRRSWIASAGLNPFLSFPALILSAAMVAAIFGPPTARWLICWAYDSGGTDGMRVAVPTYAGMTFTKPGFDLALYYSAIALMVSLGCPVHRYLKSSLGHALSAVHTNELRLEYLGIPVCLVLLIAYTISAALAGIGGSIAAGAVGHILPEFAFRLPARRAHRASGRRIGTTGLSCRRSDLHVSFHGVQAANGVNLEIREGEFFAIIGPNGSGKTTFLNLCTGCVRPTSGSVYLDGKPITAMPPRRIARASPQDSSEHRQRRAAELPGVPQAPWRPTLPTTHDDQLPVAARR
jgi:hypothetical protein